MKKIFYLTLAIILLHSMALQAQPSNNCIFNAIDLSAQINSVVHPVQLFSCRSPDIYASVGNHPTRQDLVGDPNGCEICDLTCTTKNPDHRDIWYRFTVNAGTPPVWLSIYNELPEPGTAPSFSAAIYSGTPTGVCGSGMIGGMTQIDCSNGDILPLLCPSPNPCVDGGGYGARNMGICTTPIRPRLDISGLANGTYYLRIWDWAGGTPNEGAVTICAESALPAGVTEDKCPATNTVGCPVGMSPNADFDSVYVNLGNTGMTGNACNTALDEPQVAAGPATFVREPCSLGPVTGLGYVNNVMNNTAIYRFEVNAMAPCTCTPVIQFLNIRYGGRAGNAMQVQVMSSPCAGGNNAVMAWSTDQACLELRMAGGGTLPNGTYYIVVDGQDGQIMQYDMRLQLDYTGPSCVAIDDNVCSILLPVGLSDFAATHQLHKRTVRLDWNIPNFENLDAVEIERSADGIHFERLETMINNHQSNNYYLDEQPLQGNNYYRLQLKDVDNNINHSSIKVVDVPDAYQGPAYPNPATDHIRVPLANQKVQKISIISITGKVVYSKSFDSERNNDDLTIDINHFPKGVYYLLIENNSLEMKRHQFVKI